MHNNRMNSGLVSSAGALPTSRLCGALAGLRTNNQISRGQEIQKEGHDEAE